MILEAQNRIKHFTENGYWINKTIDQIFSESVEKFGDSEALVDPLNREEFTSGLLQRFTYAELQKKVTQLASVLINNEIKKDDTVGVFLPNIHELPLTLLALAKIGAIASPYPPQIRELGLSKMGKFAEIKAVITHNKFKDRNLAKLVNSIRKQIPSLQYIFSFGDIKDKDHFIALDSEIAKINSNSVLDDYLATVQIDPNDIFSICWTSGTTGTPKGVPRSHNLWSAIAYASVDGAKLESDTVFLNPFPMVNMAGIGGAIIPWLLSGCKMVIHQSFDLQVYLQQIQKEKITYTLAPPAILNLLLKNEAILNNVDISSLKIIGSGSSPLSPWMIKSWKDKYNIDVTNFFGSNEGTCLLGDPQSIPDLEKRALYFPAFGKDKENFNHIRVQRGMHSKLIDLTSKKAVTKVGSEGELLLKGPTIFTGYYKAPETNKQVFDDEGYFKTGDVFRLIKDKEGVQYYEFIERNKDIIIRGGFNIAPNTIESLLQDFDKIKDCAVVGYPDKMLGEKIAIFIVKNKHEAISLEDITTHLKTKNIASYKLPEKLIITQAIPKNPLGKILRKQLRELV
ncbi:MAG: class I adenylate-forming enzyme family protein [Tenacibaculum sp.]